LITLFVDDNNPYYELFGILKLGRVLRLNKIIQFLNVDEDVKASMKLSKMVFFLIIYIHFYACLWWLLVKNSLNWVPPMHTANEDMYEVYTYPIMTQYMVCIYGSVLSLLGSDIFPMGSYQTLMATAGCFFGAIINANIFGELAVIMASMGKVEKNF